MHGLPIVDPLEVKRLFELFQEYGLALLRRLIIRQLEGLQTEENRFAKLSAVKQRANHLENVEQVLRTADLLAQVVHIR